MYHIKRDVSIHLFHLPLNQPDHYGPLLHSPVERSEILISPASFEYQREEKNRWGTLSYFPWYKQIHRLHGFVLHAHNICRRMQCLQVLCGLLWTQLLTHPLNQHLFDFMQGMFKVFQLHIWHDA